MTQPLQVLATVLFAAAILHTFSAGYFRRLSRSMLPGPRAHALHFLGEVEVVFGFWAAIFVLAFALVEGPTRAFGYVERIDFTEPVFVFVVMAIASTRAIQDLAVRAITALAAIIARTIPVLNEAEAFYAVTLAVGPLLGSLITEPAAMTVCALLLRERFFRGPVSERFKYKTLALLFVNVSIGGVLTHFAAPPVVMVAKVWNWDSVFMFTHFGYKALIAVVANTALILYLLRQEFRRLPKNFAAAAKPKPLPILLTLAHVGFLTLAVVAGQYASVLLGLLIFFLAFIVIATANQERVQIREPLLVGFFLAGLVVLGRPQSWWLTPLITSLSNVPLFFGATALTAVTDNAALTYLGAQVPRLADPLKYALVAGAVAGGGLTVIANAPNPAGYGILKEYFGKSGVHPGRLFVAALIPTAIAAFCLEVL